MAKKDRVIKWVTALVALATVVTALYIMAHGLGLVEGLDFGAGAYYYADIPGFETIVRDDGYHTDIPFWVYLALFLGWGFLMYRLWVRIDRHGQNKDEHDH